MRATWLMLAFAAAAPAAARAQDAAPPAVEQVFVRGTDGVEVRGSLVDFGPASLSIFVDGVRRELPLESIDRIQRRGDSVKNGALIGAAVGLGFWAITAREHVRTAPVALWAVTTNSILGAVIDNLIPGRTTIYSKPAASASTPGGKRAGLAFKIGF